MPFEHIAIQPANDNEKQAGLDGERSELPFIGDTVLALFGGKIVEAIVDGYEPAENGTKLVRVISAQGETKLASPRAFTPETQAEMASSRKGHASKELGGVTLSALDVDRLAEAPTESAVDLDYLFGDEYEDAKTAAGPVATELDSEVDKITLDRRARNAQVWNLNAAIYQQNKGKNTRR